MEDFARTAFFDLIADELARQGYPAARSGRFAGRIDREAKRSLLAGALAALGPGALVAIGARVHDVRDPALAVLRRAADPADLLDRWQRLERYHRVRIVDQGNRRLVVQHYAAQGAPPSLGEDLVVCGLLAALLEEIGCEFVKKSVRLPTGR